MTIFWIALEICAVVLTQTVYIQRLSFQLNDTLTSIFVAVTCSWWPTLCFPSNLAESFCIQPANIRVVAKLVYTKDSISITQHIDTDHVFHMKDHNAMMQQRITPRSPNCLPYHLVVNKSLLHKICLSIKFLPSMFYLDLKEVGGEGFIRRQNISV